MKHLSAFAFILSLASCCPKITETTTIQRDTIVDYQKDTITIREIVETYDTDIKSICDSIYKSAGSSRKTDLHFFVKGNNANADLKIVVDTSNNARFIATIHDYQHIADSLREVIKISESRTTDNVVYECDSRLHIVALWFSFIVLMLVVLYVTTRAMK